MSQQHGHNLISIIFLRVFQEIDSLVDAIRVNKHSTFEKYVINDLRIT